MAIVLKFLKRATTEEEKKKIIGSNLKTMAVGAAGLNVTIAQYLMDAGITLETAYSMTETAGVGTASVLDMEHLNSVGKLREGMQCKIVDGEILLKGDAVMKGYYKNEATKYS